jgi:hypothetical protein
MGERSGAHTVSVEETEENYHLEDLGIDNNILKLIWLRNKDKWRVFGNTIRKLRIS